MQPWPSLTFPVGSEGYLSSYFPQALSRGDPVCRVPRVYRVKSFGDVKFMSVEGSFSSLMEWSLRSFSKIHTWQDFFSPFLYNLSHSTLKETNSLALLPYFVPSLTFIFAWAIKSGCGKYTYKKNASCMSCWVFFSPTRNNSTKHHVHFGVCL